MFEPEAAYDEEVASLNDDEASDERESDTVMSVIDGDKPDHTMTPIRMTSHHHAVVVRTARCEINQQARRACFAFGPFRPPLFLCYDELFSFNGTGLQETD